MDAVDLKQHIIDNNLIVSILESLQCHSIRETPKEYVAGLPLPHKANGLSVYKNNLKTLIYSIDKKAKGDIFTLVMKIQDCTFPIAVKYIHKILNIPYSVFSKPKEENKYDVLGVFKRVGAKNREHISNLKILDETMLEPYINLPNIWWIKEGIPPNIQEKFKLGYCPQNHRITIPQRYWCGGENDFIGCKGRTIFEDYELLGISKYMALTKNFFKTLNVYGLQENYQSIQEAGEVIVFEGEKSVLKMATWKYDNAVAILGHELSDEQIKILIGLNVDICLAFDKDIPEKELIEACRSFKNIRRVSYIYDKDNVLSAKMSPVDKKRNTFDFLYKHKVNV